MKQKPKTKLIWRCHHFNLNSTGAKKLEWLHQEKLQSITDINWKNYVSSFAGAEKFQTKSLKSPSWNTVFNEQDMYYAWTMINSWAKSFKVNYQRPHSWSFWHYKDQIKQTMKKGNINLQIWEELATNYVFKQEWLKNRGESGMTEGLIIFHARISFASHQKHRHWIWNTQKQGINYSCIHCHMWDQQNDFICVDCHLNVKQNQTLNKSEVLLQ